MTLGIHLFVQGGADKSLARPGRKQATAKKFGIYSTQSPRSSTAFLFTMKHQLTGFVTVIEPSKAQWLLYVPPV
jgi:hypothetical protein